MLMFVSPTSRLPPFTWVSCTSYRDCHLRCHHLTGESALLLYLNNGSFEGYEKFEEEEVICHVLVKAKKGLGLMVYAEELELRKKKKE